MKGDNLWKLAANELREAHGEPTIDEPLPIVEMIEEASEDDALAVEADPPIDGKEEPEPKLPTVELPGDFDQLVLVREPVGERLRSVFP